MPHVEPGGALELAPAATDGATVRWRQFAGPAAAWGQVNLTNIPFGFNDTAENYPKFGIYRGVGAGVNIVEFANVEIGTTDLTSRITAPLPIEF